MKVQYGNSQNLGGMAPAGQPAGMGGGMPSQANPAAMGRNPMAAGAMSPLMARPGSGFLPPPDGAQMPAPPVSTNVGGLQTGGVAGPLGGGGQVGLFPQPTPLPQYERSPSPMPPQGMGGMGRGQGQGLATAPGQNRSLLPAQAQANMQAPMPGGGMSMPVPPPIPTIQPAPLQTGGLDPMPRPIPGPMPQTTMGAAGAAPNMLMQAAQSGALRGR